MFYLAIPCARPDLMRTTCPKIQRSLNVKLFKTYPWRSMCAGLPGFDSSPARSKVSRGRRRRTIWPVRHRSTTGNLYSNLPHHSQKRSRYWTPRWSPPKTTGGPWTPHSRWKWMVYWSRIPHLPAGSWRQKPIIILKRSLNTSSPYDTLLTLEVIFLQMLK